MATVPNTVYSHITKDPEVCGGRATIDGTRIRVLDVFSLKRRGHTPEQIRAEYPSLTLAQVHAALAYAYDNLAEIEAADDEDLRAAQEGERERDTFFRYRSPR